MTHDPFAAELQRRRRIRLHAQRRQQHKPPQVRWPLTVSLLLAGAVFVAVNFGGLGLAAYAMLAGSIVFGLLLSYYS